MLTAQAPADLHAFKARDRVFPHHSTVDQLFTDQKFEAYRVLGWHAARAAIEAMEHVPRIQSGHGQSQIHSNALRRALGRVLLVHFTR